MLTFTLIKQCVKLVIKSESSHLKSLKYFHTVIIYNQINLKIERTKNILNLTHLESKIIFIFN